MCVRRESERRHGEVGWPRWGRAVVLGLVEVPVQLRPKSGGRGIGSTIVTFGLCVRAVVPSMERVNGSSDAAFHPLIMSLTM